MSDGKQLDYETEESTEEHQRVPRDDGSDLPIKEGRCWSHRRGRHVSDAPASDGDCDGTIVPIAASVGADGDVVVTEMVASWKAAGWSYLSVFGTGFEADGEAATLSDAPNHGAAFATGAFSLSTLVLFLVTVGGIVVSGYAIAKYTEANSPVDAAKAGVTVAIPYLAFAAIAAFVMTQNVPRGSHCPEPHRC